jgi:hypothetical protein
MTIFVTIIQFFKLEKLFKEGNYTLEETITVEDGSKIKKFKLLLHHFWEETQ